MGERPLQTIPSSKIPETMDDPKLVSRNNIYENIRYFMDLEKRNENKEVEANSGGEEEEVSEEDAAREAIRILVSLAVDKADKIASRKKPLVIDREFKKLLNKIVRPRIDDVSSYLLDVVSAMLKYMNKLVDEVVKDTISSYVSEDNEHPGTYAKITLTALLVYFTALSLALNIKYEKNSKRWLTRISRISYYLASIANALLLYRDLSELYHDGDYEIRVVLGSMYSTLEDDNKYVVLKTLKITSSRVEVSNIIIPEVNVPTVVTTLIDEMLYHGIMDRVNNLLDYVKEILGIPSEQVENSSKKNYRASILEPIIII